MASSWKKQRIQDHFVNLTNDLDVDRIVPILRAERMLTNDEHLQVINRHYSTSDRRQKLLLFMTNKGKNHFEKFVECLVWSGQTDLAKKMKIPVEDIRPSPHPPIRQSPTQQEELLKLLQHISGLPSEYYLRTNAAPPGNPVHPNLQSNHILHPNPAPLINQIHPARVTHHTQPTLPSLPAQYPIPETNTPGGYQETCMSREPPAQYPIPESNTAGGYQETCMSREPPPQPVFIPQGTAPPVNPSQQVPAKHPPIPQRGPCKNVFILYCNEEVQGLGDLSVIVRELAGFLTRACGQMMKIHCDMYEKAPLPTSWPLWTEERIRESDCVLFVCSKSLNQRLSSSGTIQMKLGSFDATTVYNLIEPPKFVPVFLSTNINGESAIPNLYDPPYKSWVPAKLLGASRYWLDLGSLHRFVGETTTEGEYRARLTQVLQDERINKSIQPIANMLRFLQGAPDTQAPLPFPTPILPPAAGSCSQIEPTRPELTFSDHELLTISKHILRDWQSVGIKLGLSYNTLENLRLENVNNSQRAIMNMFKVWQNNKKELATRAALKDSLKNSGYGRVAEIIFSRD